MEGAPAIEPIDLRLLGRPRILVRGVTAAFPPRPGTRALFVALAYSRVSCERSWLASSIWPDAPQSEGRANLRRHLLYVERWLTRLAGARGLLIRRGSQVMLDPRIIGQFDVRRFEQLLDDGKLEEAVEVYGDDLLVESDDAWIVAERARLRTRFDEALMALVSGARGRDGPGAALHYAQIARHTDPYNEAWLRTTMRLRYAGRDRAGALAEFEAYRQLVHRDLEVEPMPETSMLADLIRRLEVAPVPTLLAFESTSFVGRVAEISELTTLLSRHAMVTVAGEPGIGKSRLAFHCARLVAHQYRDGLFMIDASIARDSDDLEQMLRRALARGQSHTSESLAEIAAPLEALLVMDGCEHRRLPCSKVAKLLSAAAPNVHVIATSREPLEATGDVMRVGPLSATDAVQLFVERLQRAGSRTVTDERDTPVVQRICAGLHGLPLAIELAAARARAGTLNDVQRDVLIATKRSDVDVLSATYDASYQSLNATERAVLRRLAFLNEWTLPVALAACADLATVDDVRRAHDAFVERSMVIPPAISESDARYAMLDATRDFAREQARRLGTNESDGRAVAGAVGHHYAALGARLRGEHASDFYHAIERDRENIDDALATLWTGLPSDRALATDLSLAVSRYWADQGYAAHGAHWLRKALDDPDTVGVKRLEVARVIATLMRDLGDYAASYRDFCELVRLQEEANVGPVDLGKSHVMAANAARMMGHFDEALRRLTTGYELFVDSGQAYLAAWAIYAAGTTHLSAGHFPEAAEALEHATNRFNDLGAVSDSSSSIGNLALCHYYEGRLDVALELASESLDRAKEVGHRYYHAHAALNQALILHALGLHDEAWAQLSDATDIARALGAQDVLISCGEIACAIVCSPAAEEAALLLGSVDAAREQTRAHRFPVDVPLYTIICATLSTTLEGKRLDALRMRGRVTPLRSAVERVVSRGDRHGHLGMP